MKKLILMTILAMFAAVYLGCGGDDNPINPPDDDDNPPPANALRINEVLYSTSQDQIEIKNFGTSSVNVSSYWFCSLFSQGQLKDLNVINGSLHIPPGGILAVSGFLLNNSAADIGLYETNSFGSSSAMKDFVQWGSGGNGHESVATTIAVTS